jgi:DNA-binding transcriptional MocR family regulator
VVTAALGQGVLVDPLQPHFTGPATLRGVLLGYGAIDEQSIAEGLARLRRAMPQ